MHQDVYNDLSRSARAMLKVIWPAINAGMGGGRLIPVETAGDRTEVRDALDCEAGIDQWQIHARGGMRGLATRVQKGDYRSFTIRYRRPNGSSTEFQKRMNALKSHAYLYPHVTIQGYVTDWESPAFVSAAAISTAQLYRSLAPFVDDVGVFTPPLRAGNGALDYDLPHFKWARKGGQQFIAVYWSWLKRLDFNLRTWPADDGGLERISGIYLDTRGLSRR